MLCSPFFHWILLWWMWTCPDMLFEIPSWWRHLTSLNVILSFYGEKVLKSADVSKNERWWWKYEPYFWLAWPFTYQMTPKASYKCFLLQRFADRKVSLNFQQFGPISVKKCWRQQKLCWFWTFLWDNFEVTYCGVNHVYYWLYYSTKSEIKQGSSFTPPTI